MRQIREYEQQYETFTISSGKSHHEVRGSPKPRHNIHFASLSSKHSSPFT